MKQSEYPTVVSGGVVARVALVHDWLNQMGGAENVLEELVDLFPAAPIYTSMYAAKQMPAAYRHWPIHTSFMQWLPAVTTHHQLYLPLYPLAFARTDLSQYELVISNKSGFCHGVKNINAQGHRAIHICYCLTPTRYLWLFEQYREREQIGGLASRLLQPILAQLRKWDFAAAQRVDHFIAISRAVQQRIRQIYQRTSVIIYPPVDTDYFTPAQESDQVDFHTSAFRTRKGEALAWGNYYLVVSRLIPYKRIDLAVQAFRHLPDQQLIVVGDGRDRAMLEAQASENVTFLGRLDRQTMRTLLRGCKAFLFPGLEDFGIAPVEAMSVGRPVIAFAGGGALDTVLPGVTGELFVQQDVESLQHVVQSFHPARYTSSACRQQAEKFSRQTFRSTLMTFVEQVLAVQR